MTAVIRPELLDHLDELRRVKDLPINEESAVRVVVRFYADRAVICTDSEARWVVRMKDRSESLIGAPYPPLARPVLSDQLEVLGGSLDAPLIRQPRCHEGNPTNFTVHA